MKYQTRLKLNKGSQAKRIGELVVIIAIVLIFFLVSLAWQNYLIKVGVPYHFLH